nr:hypothetical protein [Tanacetum cinerariifolium]
MMSTLVFVDPERTDNESEPFKGKARKPESPHIVAPPTCQVEEPEGSGTVEDEEVEESLDSDSESEDAKDEGPTTKNEDPTTGDEGLAAGVEGPDVDDESYGLDDGSYGLDDESHGVDDESCSLDDECHGVEIDRLGLEEEDEEATPPSPEWTYGSLPISPSPSVIPSPVLSPMIPLTIPSPIASLMDTLIAIIPIDEDQLIKVRAQLELYGSILQDHTQRLDAMPLTLFANIDRDVKELYTRLGVVRDDIFSQRYRFRSLEHEQERTAMTFEALWRLVLAFEAWAGRVDTRMTDMSRAWYDDHRLVHDMLLQQTTSKRELQEMRGRVTVLEQERGRRER